MLLHGRWRSWVRLDVGGHYDRLDLAKFYTLSFAPREKTPHSVRVGSACVGISDRGEEKLQERRACIVTSGLDDGRQVRLVGRAQRERAARPGRRGMDKGVVALHGDLGLLMKRVLHNVLYDTAKYQLAKLFGGFQTETVGNEATAYAP